MSLDPRDVFLDFLLDIQLITRGGQSQLRKHRLQRDGNRCLFTGDYGMDNKQALRNAIHGYLESAHIIPFALGVFDQTDAESYSHHLSTWESIYRYFPHMESERFRERLDRLNDEANILTLAAIPHREFSQFRMVLESTGTPNQYRIKTFPNIIYAHDAKSRLPGNRLVTFRSHGGS